MKNVYRPGILGAFFLFVLLAGIVHLHAVRAQPRPHSRNRQSKHSRNLRINHNSHHRCNQDRQRRAQPAEAESQGARSSYFRGPSMSVRRTGYF